MRLLITEFITGGGMANHPIPEGLKQEGLLMLNSVLADCELLEDIEIVTTIDSRVTLDADSIKKIVIQGHDNYLHKITKLANQSDATWVIAPESDNILQILIENLMNNSNKIINCDDESIRITSDKYVCTELLSDHGISVIDNLSASQAAQYNQMTVIKNRCGVGSEGLTVCQSGSEALTEIANRTGDWLIQPLVEGDSLSLSMLCANGSAVVLTCNKQNFTNTREPKLKSCLVNAMPVTQDHIKLAHSITNVLPGLKGYVGVDFISSNGDLKIVDINPRLTTSYAGLKNVLRENPAKLCIDASLNSILPVDLERNATVSEVVIG